MNEQNQNSIPNSNPQSGSPESSPDSMHRDWREQRRAEHWARHEARWQRHAGRPYSWIGGVLLILLGVVVLLENMGIPFLANWWALLIFMPAFWAYAAAWDSYLNNKRLTQGGIRSLTIGVLLTVLALAFLLNLNIGLFWPVWLIVAGLILVGTSLLRV